MWGKNTTLPDGLNSEKPVYQENMLRSAASKGRKLHVGIVGAGFAGLRCADVLLQHGHKATIFEARNRVGGRVAQSNHLGHVVDLGPNWIHGTVNNPILRLAEETKTQLHSWDEKQQLYHPDGHLLSQAEAAEYGALIWDDGLIASAFTYSRLNTATIPSSTSLLDYFREEVKKLFLDLPEKEAEEKRDVLLHITEFWGAYVGSPVERQSLKFFWLEECIEGENPFVAGTYSKILEKVAKPALDGAEIRYETKVARMYCRGGERERPGIEVEGEPVEEFDEVVVTTPLGWLKRNKSAFVPGLSKEMENAIDSIGYGSLDKVYITFPTAFWEGDSRSDAKQDATPAPSTEAKGIDPTHSTPNVTAQTAPLHQPSPSSSTSATTTTTSTYPGFTHWISPRYAPSNPKHWDFEAMNLAALPQPSAHPTLLFYIYGPISSHVSSLIASASSSSSADEKLLDFFKPYYSLLPNYTPSSPNCKPSAVLATNWVADEFAGYGSYCNFQVGLEKGGECIETMRWGMRDQGLWFAGEHTAPFVALGTATGAWGSGDGVGRAICGLGDGDGYGDGYGAGIRKVGS